MARKKRLVELLVELGFLTKKDAADIVEELPNHPGVLSGDLVVEKGLCTKEQIDKALDVQREAGSPGLLLHTVKEAQARSESARTSIQALGDVAEEVAKK